MEHNFWHERWKTKQIGFHQGQVNALLAKHFSELHLAKGARVFVPLCGKTLDIHWLLSQGYYVTGVELSEIAVGELFEELGVTPEVTAIGSLKRYSAEDIDIFAGDFFKLTAEMLGVTDAVYDRAALIALPEDMRNDYAARLVEITAHAPQFLISFDYDPSIMNGPPFSLQHADISGLYGKEFDISLLGSAEVDVRGNAATEEARLLTYRE